MHCLSLPEPSCFRILFVGALENGILEILRVGQERFGAGLPSWKGIQDLYWGSGLVIFYSQSLILDIKYAGILESFDKVKV